MDLQLDDDNYPTEESLEEIIEFKDWKNLKLFFAEIKQIWNYGEYFVGPMNNPPSDILSLVEGEKHEGYSWYRLATGGWSGNESIIDAMMQNPLVKGLTWYMSSIGGLHIFRAKNHGQ